jgi:pyruvate,water dikinase
MKFVKFLEGVDFKKVSESGVKGSTISKLHQNNFPVPDSFVITSDAYKYVLEKTQVKIAIFDILKGLDVNDTDQLIEKSKRIRKIISELKIPAKVKNEIISAYKKLSKKFEKKEEWVAVRTSQTLEDLPGASSMLNVKGEDKLLESIKKSWSSLFNPRSIFYRETKGNDKKKFSVAVIVQKQLNSDKAGVAFTVDTSSGGENIMLVESSFGQSEGITSGKLTPDKYIINKRTGEVIKKKISSKKEIRVLDTKKGGLINKKIPLEKQKKSSLEDYELNQIYNLGLKLEEYYNSPQNFEWAFENNKLFLVDTKSINYLPKSKDGEDVDTTKSPILKGVPSSPGVVSGTVKIINKVSDLGKIKSGDILVAKMTSPDYVPTMKRISAIITDEGGKTSHTAVVARELGVPCIVGVGNATQKLKTGDKITIDGDDGFIYKGEFKAKILKYRNYKKIKTKTKIYINLGEPELAKKYKKLDCDGVGLFRAEFMVAGLKEHPKSLMERNDGKEVVKIFADGIEKVAKQFYPRPVIYRALDFKTNEYANLKGGKNYEPKESNPMIGWRGASRYITDPGLFKLELEALKEVRKKYNNVWLMIPFVRTSWELRHIKMFVKRSGLASQRNFKLWIMVEVPSSAILIDEFIKEGIDGVSIGSNDLTQLTLGVDRDSSTLGKRWFYELDPAVVWCMKRVVKACKKNNITSSICGQAPSIYPKLTKKLIKWGITSVSVNPDVVDKTKEIIADAEKGIFKKILRK